MRHIEISSDGILGSSNAPFLINSLPVPRLLSEEQVVQNGDFLRDITLRMDEWQERFRIQVVRNNV
jgi:hypothetical protein